MKDVTKKLLAAILESEEHQGLWLNSHNTNFGMHPQEMIDQGREDEVISYLLYAIEGPY